MHCCSYAAAAMKPTRFIDHWEIVAMRIQRLDWQAESVICDLFRLVASQRGRDPNRIADMIKWFRY